jgi:hypothetical protein
MKVREPIGTAAIEKGNESTFLECISSGLIEGIFCDICLGRINTVCIIICIEGLMGTVLVFLMLTDLGVWGRNATTWIT